QPPPQRLPFVCSQLTRQFIPHNHRLLVGIPENDPRIRPASPKNQAIWFYAFFRPQSTRRFLRPAGLRKRELTLKPRIIAEGTSWTPSFHYNIRLSVSMNRTSPDFDDYFESFITNFFYSIGTVSSILSIPTFYLLLKKSSFLSIDIRAILLTLQITAFLNNFHFCILFAPFIYPYIGGGYCTGVLCRLGVRFHFGMLLWLLTLVLLCFSFISLVFIRLQTLLQPWSKLKLTTIGRLVFYMFTFSSLIVIPILFIFTENPMELQAQIVDDLSLDWIRDKKMFGILSCCYRRALMSAVVYAILWNIIILGPITLTICLLILHKILTANVNQLSNHSRAVYRAKIKNSVVILSQTATAFCLGLLPFSIMIGTVGTGVDQDIERRVLLSELCTTFLSPINSILFLLGNRQYVSLVRDMMRRTSNVGRLRSISK
ncbi:hypothetical protein PRIPAC_82748, partial [Pristionchus pacificus]|uniref:G protein-coupled receptor n=1 Tax=Pristionchus pacificus TaxID=54126 RepID=A0A2A6CPQ9_PRIPA